MSNARKNHDKADYYHHSEKQRNYVLEEPGDALKITDHGDRHQKCNDAAAYDLADAELLIKKRTSGS